MGSPGRAADRRHRRRAPADQQGRGRQPVARRRRRRRLPVPPGGARPADRHRRADLRQPARRSRTVRHRARPGPVGGDDDRRAHPHHEPDGELRRGARADARRPACATTATPTMAGTPFPAAPIHIEFPGRRPAVFPTGRLVDRFAGIDVTCVDAGMPVVLVRAADLGLEGDEPPEVLEANGALRATVEAHPPGGRSGDGPRRRARHDGPEDHDRLTAPAHGGTVTTRTFIPHRVHAAIGVLGAVSVAAGVPRARHRRHGRRPGRRAGTHRASERHFRRRRGTRRQRRRDAVARRAPSSAPPARSFDGLVWPRTRQEHRPASRDETRAPRRTAHARPGPRRDIAHVGPIELYTPVLEESRDFFVHLMALREVHRDDDFGVPAHVGRLPVVDRAPDPAGARRASAGRTCARPARRRSTGSPADRGGRARPRHRRRRPRTRRGAGSSRIPTATRWACTGTSSGTRPTTPTRPALKNQAAAYPGPGREHPPPRPRQLPDRRRARRPSAFLGDVLGARCTEQIVTDDGEPAGHLVLRRQQDLRPRLHRGLDRHPRPPAPRRLRHRHPRGDPARRGRLPGRRRPHRDRPAQARHPADVLPLRLGARVATASSCATPGPGSSSPPTGGRSAGPREERAKGQAWGLKTIDTFHTHGTPTV